MTLIHFQNLIPLKTTINFNKIIRLTAEKVFGSTEITIKKGSFLSKKAKKARKRFKTKLDIQSWLDFDNIRKLDKQKKFVDLNEKIRDSEKHSHLMRNMFKGKQTPIKSVTHRDLNGKILEVITEKNQILVETRDFFQDIFNINEEKTHLQKMIIHLLVMKLWHPSLLNCFKK